MPERPVQAAPLTPRSPRVRKVAALAGRSARRKQGRFRVEGPQSVRSLLSHRPDLALEVYSTSRAREDHPELAALAAAAQVPVWDVEEPVLRALVREVEPGEDSEAGGLQVTPQGVVALARWDDGGPTALREALDRLPAEGPVTVMVLHELRDPGNVGTIIRSADAAGADLVVLTRTSVDPYGPKVVRSTAGSLFHLPLVTGAPITEVLEGLSAAGVTAAATSGRAPADLFDTALPARIAWIMGNEAHGVDEETLAAAPLQVRIPLAGEAESLNVQSAATICLFESLRRRRAAP